MKKAFGKIEKLKSKKNIDSLFVDAQHFKAFPLMVFYKKSEIEEEVSKAGFTVSKKKFKLAVSRNRIKRQMREAYRLNKEIINDENSLIMMFIFISAKMESYKAIDKAMVTLLKKLKS